MRSPFLRFTAAAAVVMSIWSGTMAQSVAFDTTRMDTSAAACDDFFQFANGTWVKNTPIPPSQSSWGSFSILAESNRDTLHDILEKAAANKNATGNEKLIGDFYASCMDEAAIEKAGVTPLQPYLKHIDKISSAKDLAPTIAWLPVDISAETSWNSSAGWLAETSWIWSPWTSGSRSTLTPFRKVPKREFVSERT